VCVFLVPLEDQPDEEVYVTVPGRIVAGGNFAGVAANHKDFRSRSISALL
jgi:hypothetical protein